MASPTSVQQAVKTHYEQYVYPRFPLPTSVRLCDTYALNLDALWARFNGGGLAAHDKRILLAGCGSFSPYPTAVANPRAKITALDLSKANLARAKFHTRLHLHFNARFIEGDLIDAPALFGEKRFHFIDCYGVLHHIPDAVSALQAMHSLLKPGAVARIMVYSAGTRRSVQAARTALRLLRVEDVATIRRLHRKAGADSRFKACIDSNYEAGFDWGLADMLLHPYAKTYRLDELLDSLAQARLEPILFIHPNALPDPDREIARLGDLERSHRLNINFILLAGRVEDSEMRSIWNRRKASEDTFITLNPVIQKSLPLLPFKRLKPSPKLGFENPPLDFKTGRLLSRFKHLVRKSSLEPVQWGTVQPHLQALFLTETAIDQSV